jgi:sarcosine oxidase subunit beta
MKSTAEVVIIGGGITGTAIAYNLAKKGVKNIVLLEKNFLASGATGRCGAGVRSQWGTKMNCILAKESISFFEKINWELDYKEDCEFKQGGYLLLANTEREVSQFKKNIELQNKLDIPSKLLSPYEAKQIVPFLDTDKILAAAFCYKDGHANPFHVVNAYAKAAERLGVEICKYTTVTGIETQNGRVKKVITDKGEILTEKVVNAAEGHSKEIASMAGLNIPVYSERHQILVTEPVNPTLNPMVMSFSMNFYVQQTPHGSFLMGCSHDEPESYNISSSWDFMEDISKRIVGILPPLKDVHVVRQWAGLYNMTPDRQPILGSHPELGGFYMAVGFSGHGFMLGPMTGLLMAEHILGEKYTNDISTLDVGRFERGELVFEPSVV